MAKKLFRRGTPAKSQSVRAADLATYIECRHCGTTQIPIEHTGTAIPDHVQWARDWQRCYRQPASHRLEQYQPKSLGATWQHKHVGRSIIPHERLALLSSGKVDLWVAAFHFPEQMTVPDDQL